MLRPRLLCACVRAFLVSHSVVKLPTCLPWTAVIENCKNRLPSASLHLQMPPRDPHEHLNETVSNGQEALGKDNAAFSFLNVLVFGHRV